MTYNVKGVPNKLHVTGDVLAKIYMGEITSWNDPAIAALNSGVSLPTPTSRRSTAVIAPATAGVLELPVRGQPRLEVKVGASTSPAWPTGNGAEKNSGVAAAVQATDGAIGYVAVSYIAADGLKEALLQNQAGQYPEPTVDTSWPRPRP